IEEDVSFEALITNRQLLRGVLEAGYESPSPIQLKAIPPGKLGLDVIAQAKSGTGKTIAFGIVALEMIDLNDPLPQVLIIAPTREIAVQTQDVILSIGRFMKKLKCHVFIGGFSVEDDWKKLERCQIVVGTPGRLEFLLSQKKMPIKSLRLVVLDEIDKLLDHNFRPVIRKIFTKLPSKKQVMVFSATYEEHLLKQLHNYTYEPHHVMLAVNTPSLEGVTQYYQVVSPPSDDNWVGKYKFYEEKFKKLADLLSQVPFYQCIVFINHRGRAADLANYLTKNGWTAMNISGGLDQKARLKTMSKARNFQLRVLVCSDLIARGIDIERVNLVVNIDMPKDPETYLHRVGRTGRYGTYGLAISFVDSDEMEFLE
ncbi:6349_t:CDS:2, partial [Paraglomus occultum]